MTLGKWTFGHSSEGYVGWCRQSPQHIAWPKEARMAAVATVTEGVEGAVLFHADAPSGENPDLASGGLDAPAHQQGTGVRGSR